QHPGKRDAFHSATREQPFPVHGGSGADAHPMTTQHSTPLKHRHPGAGRAKASRHPKGRQVDTQALAEVRALLGERPRRRDLLIEHLHLIQDQYRCLSAAHLAALAQEMRLALAEVYEVATFYAHFDVAPEQETRPAVTIRVCDSLTCEMLGAPTLLAELENKYGGAVRVVRAPCMGGCDRAPVVAVGQREVLQANLGRVAEVVTRNDLTAELPAYIAFDAYTADGGYNLLRE